jgi:FlaA1/EpsC-like NDP-sugar epimerase
MRFALSNPKLKFYIGDVHNYDSIEMTMRGVDYVFQPHTWKQ